MFRKLIHIAAMNPVCVQCRFKSRTFSRTALRVLTKAEAALPQKHRPKPKVEEPRTNMELISKTRAERNKYAIDDEITYSKLQETDETFIKKMTALKDKRKREKYSEILLEGRRLIIDAIDSGVAAECIYFTSEDNLEGIPLHNLSKDVQLFKASQKQMQLWSDLTTCPGIMGIFKKPDLDDLLRRRVTDFPVSIVCDNVREPGNMGSVLRCAAAVGCSKVYVTKGCVDVWDTKVLRTGCGAHFCIPIVQVNWEDLENHLSPDTVVYLADNNFSDNSKDGKGTEITENRGSVPSYVYTDVSFGNCSSVVVVGGETEGLCKQAQELVLQRNGLRTFIPMENNINSLNSAMALSIILFEMKRQHRAFSEVSEASGKLNE